MRKIKTIIINTIPHSNQRYETVGDWLFEEGGEKLVINISEMEDQRHGLLVAVHELVEVILCEENGVTQDSVDKFDIEFEKNRKEGDLAEPGDDPKAPYAKEHCFATAVERMLCAAFGLSWKEYEDKVNSLYQ